MEQLKCSFTLILLATLVFLVNVMNVEANNLEELTYTYTSINASVRGENQLIIYTDVYKNKTPEGFTGTNAYGYEASVSKEGVVVDVATHVKIPADGFVLSGHGIAADFIRQHIEVGSLVSYDSTTKQIKVINSPVTIALQSTEFQLIKAKAKLDEAIEKLYDVNLTEAQTLYNEAEALYNEAVVLSKVNENSQLVIEKCNQAKALILTVTYYTMPSSVLEGRAIWHRPNEYNLSQIIRTLDKLKDVGINLIYVETLWGYYTNYPSEILDTHPNIAYYSYGEYGRDYLKAFITEAHKRGIEVHAWAEIFSMYQHSKVASLHPDWLLINEDGSNDNGQGHFLDPANSEVRAFILSIIREMLTKYDLDGFQYDYIRYPSEEEVKSGYTQVAMTEFKEKYHLTGDVRELIKNPINKQKWDEYRQTVISQFVKEMTDVIREYDSVNISMAVVPQADRAKAVYMQDWSLWIKNGWIDTIAPMVYVADPEYAKTIANDIQSITTHLTYQYTGIAPVYYGFSVLTNQQQIVLINEVALGNAMFASHNLIGKIEFEKALKISTNRKQAIVPHADVNEVIKVVFADLIDQSERLYIPNQKMTEDQKEQFNSELNRINSMKKTNAKELYEVKDAIFVLSLYLNLYAEGEAINRIAEQLNRLIMVLDIKISQDLIQRGYWDPEQRKERPDMYAFDYPIEEEPNQETPEQPEAEPVIETNEPTQKMVYPGLIFAGLGVILLSSGMILFRLKRSHQ